MDDAVLPEDIIFSILTLVPVNSLLRFISVCKRFNTIILKDPKFARSQLKAAHDLKTLTHRLLVCTMDPNHDYKLGFKSLDLDSDNTLAYGKEHITKMKKFLHGITHAQCLGSCNGIVFLALGNKCCMWNPSVQFFKVLPELDLAPAGKKKIIHYGVGYLSAIDDYKLVIYSANMEYCKTSVAMFSTRNNAWKCLGVPEGCRFYMPELGILSNEALHWLAFYNDVIVAIDLADEKYRTMSLPKLGDEENIGRDAIGYFNHLGASADGCLRLARFSRTESDFVKVWEMKEYNVSSSWTKLFNLERLDPPRALIKNKFLLLMGSSILGEPNKRNYCAGKELIRIDLEQGGKYDTYKIVGYQTSMIPYQETLIRIT